LVSKPSEELVAELSETRFDLYRLTLATYLGQLPPDTNQLVWYSVSQGSTHRETLSKMMKDVMGIAIPWLHSHTTVDSFLHDLNGRIATTKVCRIE
jgi:hypothetical protein